MSGILHFEDKNNARRKFPRRNLDRQVGLLCRGHYFVGMAGEIGEGGMSIHSEFLLNEGDSVVLTFQIPGSRFVSLQGEVRSTQKKDSGNLVSHGVIFKNIEFAYKREIRSYVSDRNR